jgi:F-type H+-transporting ATPase subunit gamma
MATLRQLKDRVRSLKNTQQITRAMKMVAGAKIRRAEAAMRAARPYASAIALALRELAKSGGARHPLLERRDVRTSGILLMTADKGLAGAFNSNLVRAALNLAAEVPGPTLYLVGTKGRVQIRNTAHLILADWPLQTKPFAEAAAEIAKRIADDFLSGKVDDMTLVSSRFVSTIVQRPTRMQLLPISPEDASVAAGGATSAAPSSDKPGPKNAFEFEPDPAAVLAALLPKYLEFTVFQALLETQASEFAARLIAMTNATDNAGKLIDELTLVMNKTRQAAITKEILEIVGGAEALKG